MSLVIHYAKSQQLFLRLGQSTGMRCWKDKTKLITQVPSGQTGISVGIAVIQSKLPQHIPVPGKILVGMFVCAGLG